MGKIEFLGRITGEGSLFIYTSMVNMFAVPCFPTNWNSILEKLNDMEISYLLSLMEVSHYNLLD